MFKLLHIILVELLPTVKISSIQLKIRKKARQYGMHVHCHIYCTRLGDHLELNQTQN